MIIIQHSGKQYLAKSGDFLLVDRIAEEVGANISLDVLANCDESSVDLTRKTVSATVVKHFRDKKIIVFKKKKRNHDECKMGHRQDMTQIRIL